MKPSYWIILWEDRLYPRGRKHLVEPPPNYSFAPALFDSRAQAVEVIRTRQLLVRQRCWIVPLVAGEPEEVTGA